MTTRNIFARFGLRWLISFAVFLVPPLSEAAPRIPPVPESARSAEQRSIAAQFADLGMSNAIATYLHHPALTQSLMPYERYVSSASTLPARERALLLLRTAWLTRSGYLWAHGVSPARQAGLTNEQLTRIAHGPDAAGWTAFEAAILRAADELHVDSFISDATWSALLARYDTNQMIDLVYSVGELTMHAGAINSLGVEIEKDVPDRLPSAVPYTVAAKWTNQRLLSQEPRIPPLEPAEWSPELRERLDPEGTGRRVANVFRTFVRNPPADALRGAVSRHIRDASTLSPRHRELLLMRIGVLCRSEYEFAAHSRVGRNVGITATDAARIVAGPDHPGSDPLETALLRATDELYRDDVVSAETWAALAEKLDTRQLLDVLIAVGGYRSASMAINSAGVQLDPNMEDFRFPPHLR
jgi:alkylhydroperoxidase family enzyme